MPVLDAKLLASLEPSQVDALVEVMLLAASTDGRLDDSEAQQLRRSLLAVDDQCLTRVDLDQRLIAAAKRIDAAPRSERLAELRVLLPEPLQRLAALELAIGIVTADGVIRTSEHDLLLEVAQELEIDSTVAADLVMRRLYSTSSAKA